MRTIALFMLLSCFSVCAWSHKASDGFIYLDIPREAGRLDLALVDLHNVVDLDDNDDGQLIWREISRHQAELQAYLVRHFALSAGLQPCALHWQPSALTHHSDGYYLAFPFTATCRESAAWQINYNILFDQDSLHRGLVSWQNAEGTGLAVLSPDAPRYVLPDSMSWKALFFDYFQQGVTHLLEGYDHILFLLALLLPVIRQLALASTQDAWQKKSAVSRLWMAFRDVLCIATLFTLTHSFTLALAALDLARPPQTLVEILIALSVSIAGGLALMPRWHRFRHLLALGFGLIHGFGFANVLFELAPSVSQRTVSLLAFNLGVEAGQAMLIVTVIPVMFGLRTFLCKHPWILHGSAYGIALCGLLWTWQRAFL